MSLIVKVGKAGKKFLKKYVLPAPVCHISYTRRLERVKTDKRICAMTFDDGPFALPCSPDNFSGRCLTDVLLDTLAEYDAKGTFDVVGDTSLNYPDKIGKLGTASWGGVKYDHYPDFGKDDIGGAVHNDRLIRRMIDEGHQISSHSYRHIIFGKKPYVYQNREYLGSFNLALEDLQKLDDFMRNNYNYEITMHRPPHYVDAIGDGFSSYDVCDRMGYQYLAASFDGAGWLPMADYDAELKAMLDPMKKALEEDPDFFCGQIIFQKDGYNMAKRTPVADGLALQLQLLSEYGYKVISANELAAESPFADAGREEANLEKYIRLSQERGIAFSDNTLRLDANMSYGEMAMLLAPKDEILSSQCKAYSAAFAWAKAQGLIPAEKKESEPVSSLPGEYFDSVKDKTRRSALDAYKY